MAMAGLAPSASGGTPKRWLICGASGRVGTMISNAWRHDPDDRWTLTQQRRDSVAGCLTWNFADGPFALLSHAERYGPFDGMLVLNGLVPGQPPPNYQANVTLARQAAEAAKEAGVGRFLHASSSAVYGTHSTEPYAETAELRPVDDYGRSKVEAEKACSEILGDSVMVTHLRIGNVVGAGSLYRNIEARQPGASLDLRVFADGGGPVRSHVGPVSLAKIIKTLALHDGKLPQAINVAATPPVSMADLLTAANVPWVETAARPNEAQFVLLDCSRLAEFCTLSPDEVTPAAMHGQWERVRS
jgi:nucleoside-diphosphate-sugar epimerase